MRAMQDSMSVAARRRGVGVGARQRSGGGPPGQWARGAGIGRFGAVLALATTLATSAPAQDAATAVERGAYLFAAAGCSGCHTDVENDGPALAGGRALETPFGVFYSPNITPDPETGIGTWSEADFHAAMREGRAPDGSPYFPVFPYTSFTRMTDEDLADMWAYMRTLEPVARENLSHDATFPFGWRGLLPIWRWLHFEPGGMAIDRADDRADGHTGDQMVDPAIARGAYLVNALGHCGECHTPRSAMGAMDPDRWLAGTADGPEGGKVPNITPHPDTGIGAWSDAEVLRVLETGMLPDFDVVGGGMGEVVRNSTGRLSESDRQAIVAYLRSLPAIENTEAPATRPDF